MIPFIGCSIWEDTLYIYIPLYIIPFLHLSGYFCLLKISILHHGCPPTFDWGKKQIINKPKFIFPASTLLQQSSLNLPSYWVLSAMDCMLNSASQKLLIVHDWKFSVLGLQLSLFDHHPPSPVPGECHLNLCFYEFVYFNTYMKVSLYIICPSLAYFI